MSTAADWTALYAMKRDLKRRKVGDRVYDIYRKSTGEKVGNVAMTGEWGRDDYPWEGECIHGGVTGSQATLKDAIDKIASMLAKRVRDRTEESPDEVVTGGAFYHADWSKYGSATGRAAMPQLASLDLNWANLMGIGTVVGTVGKAAAGDPPASFAAALDGIARWMDVTDAILVRRGEKKTASDGRVQGDLRRLAAALREDPTLDDLMMDAMTHGPEGAV